MTLSLDQNRLTTTRLVLVSRQEGVLATPRQTVWDLGPLLQGVLMEYVTCSYAELLHSCPFNPYSQHAFMEGNKLIWTVNTLSGDAYANIVVPLSCVNEFTIKKTNTTLQVDSVNTTHLTYQDLIGLVKEEYKESSLARFDLCFVTPTSFRQAGDYQIMPSPHLIFQNALMRYGSLVDSDKEADAETVDYLARHTRIIKYNLKSCPFSIGGSRNTKIPAFIGTMTLSVKGPAPLRGLAHMLLRFSEFGGLGIKTSMGMGGFRLK